MRYLSPPDSPSAGIEADDPAGPPGSQEVSAAQAHYTRQHSEWKPRLRVCATSTATAVVAPASSAFVSGGSLHSTSTQNKAVLLPPSLSAVNAERASARASPGAGEAASAAKSGGANKGTAGSTAASPSAPAGGPLDGATTGSSPPTLRPTTVGVLTAPQGRHQGATAVTSASAGALVARLFAKGGTNAKFAAAAEAAEKAAQAVLAGRTVQGYAPDATVSGRPVQCYSHVKVMKEGKCLEILCLPELFEKVMPRDRLIFGRGDQADVHTDHPSCSRVHCELRKVTDAGKPSCKYTLRDLGSAHGTLLNAGKVAAGKETELEDEDEIQFGFSQRLYLFFAGRDNLKDAEEQNAGPTAASAESRWAEQQKKLEDMHSRRSQQIGTEHNERQPSMSPVPGGSPPSAFSYGAAGCRNAPKQPCTFPTGGSLHGAVGGEGSPAQWESRQGGTAWEGGQPQGGGSPFSRHENWGPTEPTGTQGPTGNTGQGWDYAGRGHPSPYSTGSGGEPGCAARQWRGGDTPQQLEGQGWYAYTQAPTPQLGQGYGQWQPGPERGWDGRSGSFSGLGGSAQGEWRQEGDQRARANHQQSPWGEVNGSSPVFQSEENGHHVFPAGERSKQAWPLDSSGSQKEQRADHGCGAGSSGAVSDTPTAVQEEVKLSSPSGAPTRAHLARKLLWQDKKTEPTPKETLLEQKEKLVQERNLLLMQKQRLLEQRAGAQEDDSTSAAKRARVGEAFSESELTQDVSSSRSSSVLLPGSASAGAANAGDPVDNGKGGESEKGEGEERVFCSHILLKFVRRPGDKPWNSSPGKGSENAAGEEREKTVLPLKGRGGLPVTRSREDALSSLESVRAIVEEDHSQFGEFAAELSDCASSKKRGILGWVETGCPGGRRSKEGTSDEVDVGWYLPPEVVEEASKLRVGTVSHVIESEHGAHLLLRLR
ncbi:ppic-type ppiase domain-containing protein [Cystoisospora suis]|uniref:Ppic-type ppiase domain-containing protein n=1 Tax=Cystoisospora suis TaxID=483139 RepID=A0A2C6L226_9APIC|nr:ppic-type ppiase domain-containing protein [Cystoisospora suis]